jgi:peptidyl-lysine (3S)-dioxygenase / protease
VVVGEKHFTLLPPTDYFYLYEQNFTAAHYHRDAQSGQWGLTIDDPPTQTPWIPVDPDQPDVERYPLASKLRPIHVVLRAGELLYLPSMWYHKVAQWGDQECRTIAINHWVTICLCWSTGKVLSLL